MDIIYDGKFCYRPVSGTEAGWCHLQILRGKTHCLLLSTELPDNPGLSISNASHLIAALAVNTFGLDPNTLHHINHYPATNGRVEYFHVAVKWEVLPDLTYRAEYGGWSLMDLDELNAIIEAL